MNWRRDASVYIRGVAMATRTASPPVQISGMCSAGRHDSTFLNNKQGGRWNYLSLRKFVFQGLSRRTCQRLRHDLYVRVWWDGGRLMHLLKLYCCGHGHFCFLMVGSILFYVRYSTVFSYWNYTNLYPPALEDNCTNKRIVWGQAKNNNDNPRQSVRLGQHRVLKMNGQV